MAEHAKWQWLESGTAWRGVGVYHVTLTVPSREPLFGTLPPACFYPCDAGDGYEHPQRYSRILVGGK